MQTDFFCCASSREFSFIWKKPSCHDFGGRLWNNNASACRDCDAHITSFSSRIPRIRVKIRARHPSPTENCLSLARNSPVRNFSTKDFLNDPTPPPSGTLEYLSNSSKLNKDMFTDRVRKNKGRGGLRLVVCPTSCRRRFLDFCEKTEFRDELDEKMDWNEFSEIFLAVRPQNLVFIFEPVCVQSIITILTCFVSTLTSKQKKNMSFSNFLIYFTLTHQYF